MAELDADKMNAVLSQAADAKLLALNSNVLYPLLNKKIEENLVSLCEAFKRSGSISIEKLAHISVCRDLKVELDTLARKGERAHKIINMFPEETKQGE